MNNLKKNINIIVNKHKYNMMINTKLNVFQIKNKINSKINALNFVTIKYLNSLKVQ